MKIRSNMPFGILLKVAALVALHGTNNPNHLVAAKIVLRGSVSQKNHSNKLLKEQQERRHLDEDVTEAPSNASSTSDTKGPTLGPTTPEPTITFAPTVTPGPTTQGPTITFAPTVTPQPTASPTAAPTIAPTIAPSSTPTAPTATPTAAPTGTPTAAQTESPTETEAPTGEDDKDDETPGPTPGPTPKDEDDPPPDEEPEPPTPEPTPRASPAPTVAPTPDFTITAPPTGEVIFIRPPPPLQAINPLLNRPVSVPGNGSSQLKYLRTNLIRPTVSIPPDKQRTIPRDTINRLPSYLRSGGFARLDTSDTPNYEINV